VRKIARDAYSNTPNGVLGNEDCGQMSAWYIFAAMGFYPLNPASAEYVIGSS
jgi:putative alpha-1,2-mannosidase